MLAHHLVTWPVQTAAVTAPVDSVAPASPASSAPARAAPAPPESVEQLDGPGPDIDTEALARDFEARLVALVDQLHTAPDARSVGAALARLKSEMLAAPPPAAAAALAAFLASERDADTGLPFAVGPDGAMASVPTLRAFALDVLPSVEPELAVTVSRAVLEAATSDVESSLALRNLAWNDLDGDMAGELERRFTRFLDDARWARQPSQAYLDAFDVAVDVATLALFARLTTLAAGEAGDDDAATKARGRAAFIALDRQVVKDHGLLLDALARDPRWLAAAPLARASLMSRLDMTIESERTALLAYLGDATLPGSEVDYFSQLYPNGNYFYGNWLVTASEATPSIIEQHAHDLATLAEIDRALAAGPTLRVHETLTRVRERLLKFEPGQAVVAGKVGGTPGVRGQAMTPAVPVPLR